MPVTEALRIAPQGAVQRGTLRAEVRVWWLLLAACTNDEDAGGPCAGPGLPEIDVAGAVAGTREEVVSYELPWGETREIAVHAWYPTSATSGTPAEYIGLFEDPGSFVDAPPALPDEVCTAPLVVYSHGSQAWAGNSTPILRQLVAAGWVAVAPDHTGNTLVDNLDPRPDTFSLQRVLDVRRAIDWVEQLPADDPLAGRVDTTRVLVYGHSYGGQTSWLVGGPTFSDAQIAAQPAHAEPVGDARVVAVAPLAGTVPTELVDAEGYATLDVPVLFATGTADFDGQDAFDRAAAADVTWIELEGACHETFTSTTVSCDGVEKERGLEIVSTWIAAFGTRHVLGSEDPTIGDLLDGTTSIDPIVTVLRDP